jgi:hypothetical protein
MALAVILPAIFALGFVLRKPVPFVDKLPTGLMPVASLYESTGRPRNDLFSKMSLQVRFLQEQTDTNRFAIKLTGGQDMIKPDLLVYWLSGNSSNSDHLSDSAILLGTFGLNAFALPDQATRSGGVLALYSLADGVIVDVSKPFSLPRNAGSSH